MSAALTEIKFHGAKLIAIEGDTPETTLVAMKPIVEGMGLDWGAQQKKIRSHPVLAKGVSVTEIPSAGGPQQTLMLPLSRVGFWLALVQTERIKDAALREKVIAHQEECADVLFYRFFGGKLGGGAEGFAGDIDRTVLGGTGDGCGRAHEGHPSSRRESDVGS